MVDRGRYSAIAGRHGVDSTASGKEFYGIEFRVTQGERSGETVDYRGWLTSEKSIARTSAALRACGWKGDDICDVGELDQEVSITVEHEEYNGKTYARVAFVNPPRRVLDPAAAKKLSDRVRALAATAPIVAGSAPGSVDDPFADPKP